MKIIFFLVPFIVLFAQYNYYCLKVPKNTPARYFDGNDWKEMKSRMNIEKALPLPTEVPLLTALPQPIALPLPPAVPENWISILKDLVEAVKIKGVEKKKSKCGPETTLEPYTEDLIDDGNRGMNGDEDLMNILMDGVEIDDRNDDAYDDASDNKTLLESREMLQNEDVMLDNIDNEENIDVELHMDALKTRNVKKHGNSQGFKTNVFVGALKSRYEYGTEDNAENRDVLEDLQSYLDVLNGMRATRKQNISKGRDIRKYLNAIKDISVTKDTDISQELSLNLGKIEAFIAQKHANLLDIGDHAKNKDTLQNIDVKSYFDATYVKHVKNNRDHVRENVVSKYLSAKKIKHTTEDKDFLKNNHLATVLNEKEARDEKEYKYISQDIMIDLDAIECSNAKKEKQIDIETNTKEGIEVEENGEAADKEDEKSEKNTTVNIEIKGSETRPGFNFSYPLDDRETKGSVDRPELNFSYSFDDRFQNDTYPEQVFSWEAVQETPPKPN